MIATSPAVFDDLADVFDAMIDWPKRLAHEAPFFQEIFAKYGVASVVDVACGTGRHAAMFHSWKLRVEGADISAKMIALAQGQFGHPQGLNWTIRGFESPIERPRSFDAAVCLGNSLALAADRDAVGGCLREMFAAVGKGGIVITHVLNAWQLPDGPMVWQKSRVADLPRGRALILKGVHRCEKRSYVELAVTSLDGQATLRSQAVPFLNLEAAELAAIAGACGASEISFRGGYKDQPYQQQTSVDLIMVARVGQAATA